jgi:hypothetical protein
VVEEGVDFAQDSEVGGGDDFLFLSDDSDEEVSNDFNDGSYTTNSKESGPNFTPASPSLSKSQSYNPMSDPPQQPSSVSDPFTTLPNSDGLEAVAWHDLASQSQLTDEEESYVKYVGGVTRKIRMTTLTQVRVLNTFKFKVRAQRDCDSLCK